jgi:hypothetical protein
LPIVAFAAATVISARMLVWWAPLAAVGLGIQVDALSRRLIPARPEEPAMARFGSWCVVVSLAIAIAIVTGPLGLPLCFGNRDDVRQHVSDRTPVGAVAWVRDHPPTGLIYTISEWGDYLLWDGPPDVPLFVNSQVQLVPPQVWRDYRAIRSGAENCLELLEAYHAQMALVDFEREASLAKRLSSDVRWRSEYKDAQAVIFVRRAP